MNDSNMRYTFLGAKLTRSELIGMQCDPVKRINSKGKEVCIVSVKMATALVIDSQGQKHIVPRRRLRLNSKLTGDSS